MRRRKGPRKTIADVGEFGFLATLLPRFPRSADTIVGPGQDCAIIRCGGRPYLFTVDALVEGTHFDPAWMSPHQIGRKSVLVNASDAAAMGGQPRFLLISLGVPASYPAADLAALHAGIVAAAQDVGAVVVGGNLTRADRLFVSIALLGETPKHIVTRQGACAGDRIYVTGTLGDAALGCRLLQAGHRRGYAIRRFREPSPRLAAGRLLTASRLVSAMIDVSDGLIQDLGHICEASRVGALVRADSVPRSSVYRSLAGSNERLALQGGEDYELLCTVPERKVKQLERSRRRMGCPITCIGEITEGRRVRLVGAKATIETRRSGGYDHFRAGS